MSITHWIRLLNWQKLNLKYPLLEFSMKCFRFIQLLLLDVPLIHQKYCSEEDCSHLCQLRGEFDIIVNRILLPLVAITAEKTTFTICLASGLHWLRSRSIRSTFWKAGNINQECNQLFIQTCFHYTFIDYYVIFFCLPD